MVLTKQKATFQFQNSLNMTEIIFLLILHNKKEITIIYNCDIIGITLVCNLRKEPIPPIRGPGAHIGHIAASCLGLG